MMTMMRLLHAIAALFTAIMVYIRQKCVTAAPQCVVGQAKSRLLSACGDTSLTDIPLPSEDCVMCARAGCFYECGQPKYKRDPEISVDNENIGQHPHDIN